MLGTQPVQRQSPPIRSCSTAATSKPSAARDLGGREAPGAQSDDDEIVAPAHASPGCDPVGAVPDSASLDDTGSGADHVPGRIEAAMKRFAALSLLVLVAAGCGGALTSEPAADGPGGAAGGTAPAPPPESEEVACRRRAGGGRGRAQRVHGTRGRPTSRSTRSPWASSSRAGRARTGSRPSTIPRFVGRSRRRTVARADGAGGRASSSDDEARAYPLQILIWHEIVNDTVGGVPVAVTFCPLCNTAIAFDRRLDGQVARLRDDRQPAQLRSRHVRPPDRELVAAVQRRGDRRRADGVEAHAGPGDARRLGGLRRAPPRRRGALERDRASARPYGANPYAATTAWTAPPFFPVEQPRRYAAPPKERVVLILRGDEAVVVPFAALEQAGRIEVEAGGDALEVAWIAGVRSALDDGDIAAGQVVGSAEVRSVETGELVAFDTPFWFAVAAFRPDVEIVQ